MGERTQHAEFKLAYDDETVATIVARSLREEIGEIDDDRSDTTLSRTDGMVILRVQATDLIALRAAMNTWLSLVAVAERSVFVAEHYRDRE